MKSNDFWLMDCPTQTACVIKNNLSHEKTQAFNRPVGLCYKGELIYDQESL